MGNRMVRLPKLKGHSLRPAQSYSPQEIANAAGVAETTVRAWIRDGKLPAMTNGNPHLVLGSDIQAFFASLRKPKAPLMDDEFRCMHCKKGQKPMGGMVDFIHKPGSQTGRLEALCEVCGHKMCRGVSAGDFPRLSQIYDLKKRGPAGN